MKYNYISFYVLAIWLISGAYATNVYAQGTLTMGPEIGVNVSRVRYVDIPNQSATPAISYRTGISVGAFANISYQHLAFQPSVLFSTQGFALNEKTTSVGQVGNETSYYNQTYLFKYIKIPFNFVYSLHSPSKGLQFYLGGYLSFLLGGNVKYDNLFESNTTLILKYTQSVKPGSEFKDYNNFYTKRLDSGVQAGIGYRWKALLFRANYQLGLVNIAATYPSPNNFSPKFYNENANFSLNYFFLTKRKQ